MTYETFKEKLMKDLEGHFKGEATININAVPRNNQGTHDGLVILELGKNIAPTIYIEEFYEQMEQGETYENVYKQILTTYYEFRPEENIDTSYFCDFNNMRHSVVYKLVHYDSNKELLEQIPHIPFLDLAIVFYCLVASSPSGTATILIQNNHLKLWGCDTKELYELAKINTPKLLPAQFEKLSDLLSEFSPCASDGEEDFSDGLLFPIYVLTNRQRFLGAVCMLYDGYMEELAKKMDTDFYIIPSSTHEVLLIPALTPTFEREEFDAMIQDVNATQLEKNEILSDHLYYYNRIENRISA